VTLSATTAHFLWVAEREGVLAIGQDDLLKYAGPSQVIACALTFRLFRQAFADLSPDAPPLRDTIVLRTAFPGEGVHDCAEMIARVRSGGRLALDLDLGPVEAPPAPAGRFYFEIAIAGRARAYWPRPGIFDPPFVDMVTRFQDGAGTAEEQQAYRAFKCRIIATLMAAPEGNLFASREVAP
jgi:hypothetical protein